MFDKVKEKYNILYVQTFYYFEDLWGKDRGIIVMNVSLALTMTHILLLLSTLIFTFLFFELRWLFFLNELVISIVIGFPIVVHYYLFEHNKKYLEVIKLYEKKYSKNPKLKGKHKKWSRIYLFGPLVFFMFIISYYIITRG